MTQGFRLCRDDESVSPTCLAHINRNVESIWLTHPSDSITLWEDGVVYPIDYDPGNRSSGP